MCVCLSQYTTDVYGVSRLIEKAVSDAEASGAAVLTLGLLNQASTSLQPFFNALHFH